MVDLLISASILASDFSALGEEVRAIDDAGADMIHIDVMDGHFVPNLTIGPSVVRALRSHTTKPFDVHLMISSTDDFIGPFADAGAQILSIHPEAGPHLHRTLGLIRDHGVKPGVVLNPASPLALIEPVLDMVDLVLLMTVNPGFGGQAFIENQIDRIATARRMIDASGRDIRLEVDGGITPGTAEQVVRAGADTLVAGSAVFAGGPSRYAENIAALREAGSALV